MITKNKSKGFDCGLFHSYGMLIISSEKISVVQSHLRYVLLAADEDGISRYRMDVGDTSDIKLPLNQAFSPNEADKGSRLTKNIRESPQEISWAIIFDQKSDLCRQLENTSQQFSQVGQSIDQ
jgi:hypothetical protein